MTEYIFCYRVKDYNEAEKLEETERGVVIAPDMSGALKKIESYYGEDILSVTIEYLEDDYCDNVLLTENAMIKAHEQLKKLKL